MRHAGERRTTFRKVKNVKTEAEAALRTQQLLPRLVSSAQLPFSAASLEQAAALKKPKYTVAKNAAHETPIRKRRKAVKTRNKRTVPKKTKKARR